MEKRNNTGIRQIPINKGDFEQMKGTTNDIDSWIQIIQLNEKGHFVFTKEYKELVGVLWDNWEAKAFVAHVISQFDDQWEHLLDCWDEELTDAPNEFDIEPYRCHKLAETYEGRFGKLGASWYRNLFRCKLITLKLPKKLIEDYKYAFLKRFDFEIFAQRLLELLINCSVINNDFLRRYRRLKSWILMRAIGRELKFMGLVNVNPFEENGFDETMDFETAQIKSLEKLLEELIHRGVLNEDAIDGFMEEE